MPFMCINMTRSVAGKAQDGGEAENRKKEIVPMSDCYGNVHQIHPKKK